MKLYAKLIGSIEDGLLVQNIIGGATNPFTLGMIACLVVSTSKEFWYNAARGENQTYSWSRIKIKEHDLYINKFTSMGTLPR